MAIHNKQRFLLQKIKITSLLIFCGLIQYLQQGALTAHHALAVHPPLQVSQTIHNDVLKLIRPILMGLALSPTLLQFQPLQVVMFLVLAVGHLQSVYLLE